MSLYKLEVFTIWHRLIPLNPVIFVRPQLLALVMCLADEALHGLLAQADGLHVGHSRLGGPVILEVSREIIVVSLLPLAPALVWLHEPALRQLGVCLPTILELSN